MNNGILYWNKKRLAIEESNPLTGDDRAKLILKIPISLNANVSIYSQGLIESASVSISKLINKLLIDSGYQEEEVVSQFKDNYTKRMYRYHMSCYSNVNGDSVICYLYAKETSQLYALWKSEMKKQALEKLKGTII